MHRFPAPTTYLEDRAAAADPQLVSGVLPADVADELRLLVLWCSLRLGHRLPVDALLRHLVLGVLAHANDVLAELELAVNGISAPGSDPATE